MIGMGSNAWTMPSFPPFRQWQRMSADVGADVNDRFRRQVEFAVEGLEECFEIHGDVLPGGRCGDVSGEPVGRRRCNGCSRLLCLYDRTSLPRRMSCRVPP
jgi:hypothetical protein